MFQEIACPCGKDSHSEPKTRDRNGNCKLQVAPDGLPFQCVGTWATNKHFYIRSYIEATAAARKKYIQPPGDGGAAFIDLFAGPGLASPQDVQKVVEGSPLIALHHSSAPFSQFIFCDIEEANIQALRTRCGSDKRVTIIHGNSNELIPDIKQFIPRAGLNIALIDPFAPSALCWESLKELGSFLRMDLIINLPVAPLRRFFDKPETGPTIDKAIGTSKWRESIHTAQDVPLLINYLKSSLAMIGYTGESVRSIPIRNSKEGVLYYLVFASKHPLGDKIWQSIAKMAPTGQMEFGGM
jgi:three-Cys-motif partner protein